MTRAIAVKDLKVMWTSPVPYVVAAAFHLAFGLLGTSQIAGRGQAVFQPLVPIAGFLLVVVAPVLAARSFAEEWRHQTLDLLLAVPVRTRSIVAGKYAAVAATSLVIVAPALVFVVLLTAYGDPDPGPILSGVAGLALLTLALSGIGVLASSMTSSQPAAAVGAMFAVLVLWFAHTASDVAPTGGVQAALSVSERLRAFAGGVVAVSDVVFFVSVAAASLVLAGVAVGARRR